MATSRSVRPQEVGKAEAGASGMKIRYPEPLFHARFLRRELVER